MLYEITNRGRTNAIETFNDSRTGNDTGSFGRPGQRLFDAPGLCDRRKRLGHSAPRNGKLFTATAPIAKNPDGSTITGTNTDEFDIDKNATPAAQRLTYPAATADKSKATLTVRRNYADTPIAVPASDWDYVDAKLNAVKLTSGNFGGPGSFGPTALYEFTYEAKDPMVVGLGFAAIRDIATFLRNAETDDRGTPNPLAGEAQYIYSFCSSQPCRTMHDYVKLGFNQAEHAAAGGAEGL